jgi:hypothetical protein
MRALADFQGNVASLHATSAAYADYISYEGQHDDYFVLAPVETIRRLERTIGDALAALAQLIVRLPPDARGEFLRFENTQPISKARESQQRACAEIARLSADDELTELAVRVDETCRNFPQNYYVVPMAATAPSQPDQVGSSEPQEVTEPGE